METNTLVIGAGPSGLAISAALIRAGVGVTCLERSGRAGGMLGSVRRDGFLAETGPHSLRFAGDAKNIPGLTEVADLLIDANPLAKKRFLTRDGRAVAAPMSPTGIFSTPLLSLRGKLRMVGEPFVGKIPEDNDESVADFVRRRLGDEALERLVDAVVGGIYAGRPEELSLRHALPALFEWEQRHGSLLRGVIATGKERRAKGKSRIASFAGGMTELPDTLAKILGDSLRLHATVTAIETISGGWRVRWSENGSAEKTATAKHLVIATPSHAWEKLPLPGELAPLAARGARVPHPPVSIVTLGYAREQVRHPLDGFGVLTPGIEKRRALGVLFPSSLFPNRAPEGAVTLATFVGGARQPELARLPEEELVRLAQKENEELLHASGKPVFAHVTKWERAIPQYTREHGALLADLAAAESAHHGLYFIGNYRGGPAVTSAMENAASLGVRIAGR